jgi:pyruvate dehydrogenase E2 component (dihydrolipoamide acetyltransferase)
MTEAKPLTRMRRAIAKSMTLSAAVPQFGIEMTLDAAALSAARARRDIVARPSYTDALVASVAQALRDHPAMNASYVEDGILEHEDVNVALAVALDEGLISPVIVHADRRTVTELAAERSRGVEAAKAGTLKPQDVLSATFTVSNLGPFGVRRFRALVVPPQAGILAVGSMERETIVLSLSVDHRVLDGAPAARFLRQVKLQLEDPAWLERLTADQLPRAVETAA